METRLLNSKLEKISTLISPEEYYSPIISNDDLLLEVNNT